jgi:hypothetical protein
MQPVVIGAVEIRALQLKAFSLIFEN